MASTTPLYSSFANTLSQQLATSVSASPFVTKTLSSVPMSSESKTTLFAPIATASKVSAPASTSIAPSAPSMFSYQAPATKVAAPASTSIAPPTVSLPAYTPSKTTAPSSTSITPPTVGLPTYTPSKPTAPSSTSITPPDVSPMPSYSAPFMTLPYIAPKTTMPSSVMPSSVSPLSPLPSSEKVTTVIPSSFGPQTITSFGPYQAPSKTTGPSSTSISPDVPLPSSEKVSTFAPQLPGFSYQRPSFDIPSVDVMPKTESFGPSQVRPDMYRTLPSLVEQVAAAASTAATPSTQTTPSWAELMRGMMAGKATTSSTPIVVGGAKAAPSAAPSAEWSNLISSTKLTSSDKDIVDIDTPIAMPSTDSKTPYYIAAGVLGLGLIGYLAYRASKKG